MTIAGMATALLLRVVEPEPFSRLVGHAKSTITAALVANLSAVMEEAKRAGFTSIEAAKPLSRSASGSLRHMDNLDRSKGCIYCGIEGPYTSEHVIPAGLGAGDELQLRDLVCSRCNSSFSEFEVRVLRRGDVGLGRLAFQARGRGRGGKTRPPRFETVSTKLIREDGRAVEASLGHRLEAEILPHVTLRGHQLEGGGSDRAKIDSFLGILQSRLHGRLCLIRKGTAPSARYTRIDLQLGPMGYEVRGSEIVAKPPADAIWLVAPAHDGSAVDPTVLLSAQGTIVVQVSDAGVDATAAFLTLVKANLSSLIQQFSKTAQSIDIQQPGILVTADAPAEVDVARLMVKIGFNLLIHEWGAAVCRDERFDELCRFVRTSAPERSVMLWPDSDGIAALLRTQFSGEHWMMLAPMPNPHEPDGATGMAFACSLYGGIARLVFLCEDLPRELRDSHVIVAVDYQAQKVRRFDLAQFLAVVARTGP